MLIKTQNSSSALKSSPQDAPDHFIPTSSNLSREVPSLHHVTSSYLKLLNVMTILDNHLKDFISDSGTIFKDMVCRLLCSCHESETQVRGHLLALHFSTHRSMMTAHCRGHGGSHREMFRGQAEKEHQEVPSPGWDASTQPQASRRRHLEVFSWPGSSGHVLQGSELPATEVTKSSRCPTVWTQSVDIFTPSLCVLSVTTSLSDQFSFHSGPPRSVFSP